MKKLFHKIQSENFQILPVFERCLSYIPILTLAVIIASCSLSKTFHKPDKLSFAIEKNIYYTTDTDTIYHIYDESIRQLTYTKGRNDTINKDYTISVDFFESESGNKLNGWMLTPKNQKPIATILHYHGSGGNLLFHHQLIGELAERGFQVFTFDYSGYGYSEGKSTRKNVEKDAFSAFDYFMNRKEVEGTKVILYGQSYGGYLAAFVGATHQDKIDAMVIEAAFTSHRAEAAYTVPVFGNIVKNGTTTTLKAIQKNHKPLLVIHSSEDKRVPFKMGEAIYEDANAPKEFYQIDEGHIAALRFYADEISLKIKKMILLDIR